MDTSVLIPTRWGMIFILLSMDVIRPLCEAMGLRLRDKDSFREMLRRLILENRRIYEQNPEAVPPLADRVLEQMEANFGESEADHFYKWATTVYNEVHANQPQWSAWETLFFQAAYNPEMRDRLGLPSGKCDSILTQYRDALDMDDVEQEVENLKAKLLSDWDLEMYAIHQFNNDDLSDPFSIVLRTVRMNLFQIFWEKLIPQLSTAESMQLWKRAQSLLESLTVWMPENEQLRYPNNLRRQI